MSTKSSKIWLAVTVSCPEQIVEAVSDQMGVMSGSGVEIHPLEPSGKQMVTGFFVLDKSSSDRDAESAAAIILDNVTKELEKLYAIYNLLLSEPETRLLDDQDWSTSWQKFFSTIEIVPGLVIKPSWEEYVPDANQHVIKMDPGMAFGTGQHASTILALKLIASCFDSKRADIPRKVLDIGTGTGILAMATAVFGAEHVMAIDNDPEAVTIANQNVHANHLDWNVGVSNQPLKDLGGPYDLICANIVHDVLVEMAPTINRLTFSNSKIILSGILNDDQEKNLEQVYLENGMRLVRAEHDDEWTAMLLQKSN